MNFLKSMLSEKGEISSGRTVAIVLALIVIIKYVAFNTLALVHGGTPIPWDAQDIAIIGVALGAKVTQAILGENK